MMLEFHISSNKQMTSNYATVSAQMKGFNGSKAQLAFSVLPWLQIKGTMPSTMTPKYEKVLCSNYKHKVS